MNRARLTIAGIHSGVGKTTLTAGLIAAFARRDLAVQPFKAGPDYIDPTYHTLAAGRPCRNLDTWMVPPNYVQALFAHAASLVDLAIVEGVMGLYDGFSYQDETGSTAQIAKLLDTPVVLVLDAGKMARSAGAMALGYAQFDPDLPLAGFVVNQVGSDSHGQGVAAAIEQATGRPVFGWLPRHAALEIPERHLGLVPTAEPGRWQAFIDAAAAQVERYLDLDHLLAVARQAPPLPAPNLSNILPIEPPVAGDAPVIAVARDEAFNFTYQDNLDLLRAAGAELAFFSPLHDVGLPPAAGCIILSGGFPELYAAPLSANVELRRALRQAHARKIPIYAECGGLMYLTESITDLAGQKYPMVGLLPGHSVMTERRLTLGYRLARAANDSWLLAAGETVRGHEFHYSEWSGRPSELPPTYHLLPAAGQGEPQPEGAYFDNLWASYVHLHFWSKPELAVRFARLGRISL
ncbi:MAG: cobyrinate a,c-diamide synthase [Anaerolineae bacterium]|nr:cobyrinate a,c-diamide synthase [Anaerolineae bacterium]